MRQILGWMLPLLLLAAPLVACLQGEGDRCEIDSDCGKGLVCCPGSNTCQVTCQTAQPDAAVVPDAEVGVDGAVPLDAAHPDAETLLDAEVSQDASP